MGKCTICGHAEREAIDRALVRGEGLRGLAERYGTSHVALFRHKRHHIPAKGQPTGNPYAERVIRTIKEEEVYLNEYQDLAQARAHLGHFIEEVYQHKRIHSALDYLTPD